MCTNTCEGVYCQGNIEDPESRWIRPPIGKGAMRLPGFQCLDRDTRKIMTLGFAKVKELRAMSRKERLDEALQEKRKCWACGGRCEQVNPPCAPTCSSCGKHRNFLGITYRLWFESGGEAAEESAAELYDKAVESLSKELRQVTSAFPQAVFYQQLTDCCSNQ